MNEECVGLQGYVKLCLDESEEKAERGLLKVAPVVADKPPPAIHGFAKMAFFHYQSYC